MEPLTFNLNEGEVVVPIPKLLIIVPPFKDR